MLTPEPRDEVARVSVVARELLRKYSRPVPRYTSYPPIPAWSTGLGPEEYRAALQAAAGQQNESLSLYCHLPFCPRRCLYCGCNVTITRRREALETYLDRLEEEFDLITGVLGRGRQVSQLHLGGGTPNYLDDAQLERLWRAIERRFAFAPGADTAIEMDPRLSGGEQLARLHGLGFRRVSFGVQDLDPHVQRAIGREQPTEQVRGCFDAAREAGFDGINVDLIYGLPEQTPDRFRRTIETIVELQPDRVACFGYAHVPTMRPHQRALGRYALPDASERFTLNQVAIELLTGAGYVWIGLDHFARPGDPLVQAAHDGRLHRNFNGYTTAPAAHLIGAGNSAIGEVAGWLLQNDNDLGGWHGAIAKGDLATVRGHRLTVDDLRRRAAIQGLMCDLQLPLSLADGLQPSLERLLEFEADGLVERRPETVAVTPLGRYFLRTLCAAFDAYLPATPDGRPISQAI